MHDKNKDAKSFTEERKYLLNCYFFDSIVNIVGTPPPLSAGRRLNLQPSFQKGGRA